MQFGGQTITSLHYSYNVINRPHFILSAHIGFGLNENGDDYTGESAIYGLHSGIYTLLGKSPLFIETGIYTTTYFQNSKKTLNINAWFGLRFDPYDDGKLYFSAGYTPTISNTKINNVEQINHIPFGFKIGYKF